MDFTQARARLMAQLSQEIHDRRVLRAMEAAPRHLFVPAEAQDLAYADIPLPIGEGQTISQPFMVAFMTQALALTGQERVLEVGTGSGYQSAILARLARWVVTVERVPALAERAQDLLQALGHHNVEVHRAEASLGWKAGAPYDAIIVTAAAPRVPQSLLDQLKDGGRLVIPVGSRWDQDLLLVIKKGDQVEIQNLGGCRFVPLVGDEAWPEDQPAG